MSELSTLHVQPGQGAIFDGDDPKIVGYAPHSRHCLVTAQRSHRWGEPRRICVTNCPRRQQIHKYELGGIAIPAELVDEAPLTGQ